MSKQREMEKLEAQRRAVYEVQLFENQLDVIKSIHKECDDEINWEQLRQAPAPFDPSAAGPKERAAQQELNHYQPSRLQRWLGIDAVKRKELTELMISAAQEDLKDYRAWRDVRAVAIKIAEGDVDTYLAVIEELSPLDDLSEFGSGFEFSIEDPSTLEVEFDVNSDEVIPKETKSLTKTGKLSVKAMTKTKYYDLYQDYVCSCVLRVARDMFAVLPFERIYVHAMDQQVNSSTGHKERITILSVLIDREQLHSLNFETIDCSDSMQNFTHQMKFLKTSGFKAVDKLEIPG